MSKHMKFVVSVLFAVILLLTAAFVKFYSDTGKNVHETSNGVAIEKKLDSDGMGNRIFQDKNGLYGVIDSSERVIVTPEWIDLKFTENSLCIASKRVGGKLLTGCIDYNGDIAVPLIYRDILPYSSGSFDFYIANPASDSSCVLYDKNFYPLFSRSWDSSSITNNELILTAGNEKYTYSLNENSLVMKRASLGGKALESSFTLNVFNSSLLERLDPDMLGTIVEDVGKYIEFAFTGSSEYIAEIKTAPDTAFGTLFPNEKRILSKKLTGVSGVSIKRLNTEAKEDIPRYSVTITVDTEIAYADSKDNPQTMKGSYKAVMEFIGSSVNDLAAVSGSFTADKPDYPEADTSVTDNDKAKPTGTGH